MHHNTLMHKPGDHLVLVNSSVSRPLTRCFALQTEEDFVQSLWRTHQTIHHHISGRPRASSSLGSSIRCYWFHNGDKWKRNPAAVITLCFLAINDCNTHVSSLELVTVDRTHPEECKLNPVTRLPQKEYWPYSAAAQSASGLTTSQWRRSQSPAAECASPAKHCTNTLRNDLRTQILSDHMPCKQ